MGTVPLRRREGGQSHVFGDRLKNVYTTIGEGDSPIFLPGQPENRDSPRADLRSDDGRADRHLKVLLHALLALLQHDDAGHVFLGIGPRHRAIGAAPTESALAASALGLFR